ncbi:Na+/H+ antiporter [Pedobacter duraquae]|uniref:Sodium/proton antiporter (CPA1 family) n=1 Tax=Pedobacter duraquae TaxID=425511 RepID=A0A4R6IL96_9SPHI|nr:Na+/H+ antiporter [Pedobacter duraquae]TDO22847.1 sodium/proton antiporter (CPA1 family) [Pedobacter duraquae]
MTETIIPYLGIVIVILLLVTLAQKIKIAYPVMLVVGGLLISLLPGLPQIKINPELIFIVFLPPLLYDAAWETSWKDLWRWRRVITSFAFLVVLATSLVVALVSNMVIPGFTLALGFLLGGIVSPPDAVSASAILKTVKVPKRISAVIEGESLLNDASSLIVFRFALLAVNTGTFVFHKAAADFVLVIALGILIGVLVGLLFYYLHKWLPTDSNVDVILMLLAPYVMYITAESFHFSGVLAVVSGGLFLSARSHSFLSHKSRLRGSNVWSAFSFFLNGLVFMLIGLELPEIVGGLGGVSLKSAIGYGLLITAVLVVTRIIFFLGTSAFTTFISRYIKTADSRPGWRGPLIAGWAGMRGVVSLAAALSIPIFLTDGTAFPQRNLILFITFTVILLTLVVQGLTLPFVIRWVHMKDPDHYNSDKEQADEIRRNLAEQSLSYLREHHAESLEVNTSLQELTAKLETDLNLSDEETGAHHEEFKQVYLRMLDDQRLALLEMNKKPETDEAVIRKYQGLLDIEEEKIRLKYD